MPILAWWPAIACYEHLGYTPLAITGTFTLPLSPTSVASVRMPDRPVTAAPAPTIVRQPPIASRALARWLRGAAPALALVVVVVAFAVLTGAPARYLSPLNLRVVLAQTVIVAMAAIGMTIIMIGGGIDLSVGATIALTGVVAALALQAGAAGLVAILLALVVGGAVGLANGLFVTRLRIVPFIATLGMLGIARGVAKWLAHEQTVNFPRTWVNELLVTFPRQTWMIFPPGVWLTHCSRWRRRSSFGRRCSADTSSPLAPTRPRRVPAASPLTG